MIQRIRCTRAAALALACGFIAVTAQAAPPIGSFLGRAGGGNGWSEVVGVLGWALDDDGVAAVDILVDGRVAGRALYGSARPGVTQRHPGFPDSARPGFSYFLDTTRYLNGMHVVSARVISRTGERRKLQDRRVQFGNNTASMKPFGQIDFADQHAELLGDCQLTTGPRRYVAITGFVLDAGVQAQDTGVGFVELLIDRSLMANTKVNCADVPAAGGLANCYGLRRTDVAAQYVGLKDSVHSGFRFILDVGALLAGPFPLYLPGHHTLTIRAGDLFGQVVNVDEIPVTFRCEEALSNEGSKGEVDSPEPGLLLGGEVTAQGWALDWESVHHIVVLLDGQEIGQATHGFVRPDVTSAFPGYPESAAPGWRFSLDTTLYADGAHDLQVIVYDDLGVSTMIGQRQVVFQN